MTKNVQLAKVWPLEPGIKGLLTTDYSETTLVPGAPGFMELESALEAEKAGKVQLMAGKSWNELKEPRTEPTKVAPPKPEPVVERKVEYKTAETKPEPEDKRESEDKAEYRTADMKPAKSEDEDKDANAYRTTDIKPQKRRGRPPKQGN